MASSSSSSSNPSSSFLPAPDAVQVLVSSLADESPLVRDASMAALKEIAPLNPLLVLNCCLSVSRGGRRRFGNMAGAFVVMASAVHSMDQRDVDPALMGKLTKIATAEMITSKELYADWQRAAASLLVSIGSHDPDLLMEEIFLHMSGPNSSVPAMVQILADFASAEAMQFTPRLKDVLSRVLPILGNVKDAQRPIFANAFKCWFQAAWQYVGDDDAPAHILDSDIMSFLSSVFELLWKVWASSRDLKVRSSSVEALGQMVGLVTRTELKSALPRLVSTILELYKRDQDVIFLATCSLHGLLNATLLSESGPPLLDFEEVTIILCTLLPEACVTYKSDGNSNFSVGLKIYNEVQHCFLEVGSVYPDDLFVFLLNKCQAKDEALTLGALCVVKHLLPRLIESWHSKRSLLIEAAKLLLHEENLGIRKALAELLLVMASHCYLTGSSAELFVEYLVRQCAISDKEIKDFSSSKEGSRRSSVFQPFQYNKLEVKMGDVYPEELRAICEKGLILLAVTIPEMEHMLWPFILKMVIQRKYSAAVATVCRCVSELCRRRSYHNDSMLLECSARSDIPSPEELFARLIVLLHDPLAREQLPTQILTALWHLAPIFPKNISLFWEDEIPKMKAYVSDTDDLKQDTSYQETWDSMVINFLAESLDVIQDSGWIMSLGDAFSRHYELYAPDDEHSGFLHRCLGMLLQKVDDRAYVRDKINWMYKNANISVPTNRLGLAKGMGLVASSHLDTVLEKLKEILNNVGQNKFQRFLSFFSGGIKVDDTDDIHAGLALMYGYAARYAPSTVIEARIDALVGTNMLSRLLHVHHPVAKQAVITAIDLLGQGVINASESGVSFPLKRRDQLLDYTLTLMGVDENDGLVDSGHELLRTLTLALSACTTLVSVEPKLTVETRNRVLKATLGFFALSNDPSDIVEPLIDNLITLLCTILLTSGEDGRSRVEQLLHILRQIDIYVSSPMENQRKRGCTAAYELLVKFRTLCSGGYCGLGCHANCMHKRHTVQRNFSNLPSAYVLPSRDSLSLGERVIVYLPRCADTNSDVRKMASQIICLFFGISLSLPRSMGLTPDIDIEISYNALGSLEDVISILRSDASIDQSEIFNRVVSSVCSLLTKDELVITLHGCTSAICDKVRLSAEGTIQAVVEFITKRGNELNEADVTRTTQSLLSATMLVTEKYSRQEILNAICCLAESTDSGIIFSEVLATAGRDIITKDISRLRGGWPIQDAFHAFSQHGSLSFLFLEHVISVLNQNPLTKGDAERGDVSGHSIEFVVEKDILEAALLALNSLFRGGGKTGKKAVEKNYATVLSALILQLGSCHGLARSGHLEPLWILLNTFQSFCECMGDLEMGKILARDGEQNDDKWVSLIGELACCISIKRPKEVQPMCAILCKALNRHQRFQRDASASALSEFIRFSDGVPSLLEQMVEAMCLHVSDDSPTVRRLCLRGLVQIPSRQMIHYATQVLSVIVALLEDPDESVQLTAVECALMVLESPPKEAVDPVLLNLSLRLRNLQISTNVKMRSSAFAAYGALCNYSIGAQQEAFFEQVHATLPRLVLHIHDDDSSVRQACWNTLRRMVHLLGLGSLSTLFDGHCFNSNHRSHYEDFVRDVTRQICQKFSAKADVYMSSAIQAFDAPWPIIQANAIYFSSCMLTLLEDHRSWAPYLSQVVGMLISKMSRSPDAVVRATCSSALSLLLRISNSLMLTTVQIDRSDSASEGSQSRMSL